MKNNNQTHKTAVLNGAGSFGVHVTIPETDPNLEAMMNTLAASITFMPADSEMSE